MTKIGILIKILFIMVLMAGTAAAVAVHANTASVRYSSDAGAANTAQAWTKVKEITLTETYTGSIKVSYNIGDYNGIWDGDVYGRLYKDGVAIGTEITAHSDMTATRTETFNSINWASGSKIQVYGSNDYGTDEYVVDNFRIYFDYDADNTAPTVPVTTAHSTYHSGSTTVLWSASSDTQGDAIHYHVKVGTSTGGTNVLNTDTDTDTTSDSFSLSPTNTYYFSGQSCDEHEACSAWAAEKSFAFTNTAPAMTGNAITPTTAYTTSTLTSTTHTASDSDGDTPTLAYQWYDNGGVYSGKTASTLGTPDLTLGHAYKVRITPSDTWASGTATYSNEVTITTSNTAPTVPVTTAHSAYHSGSTTVLWSASTDPESNPIHYHVKVGTSTGGTNVLNTDTDTDTTSDSFSLSPTNTYYFSGMACDNSEACSAWAAEKSFAFTNTAPAMTGNAITPTTAYTADTLTSSTHTASDADGDTPTFTYQWYDNGGVYSGKTSSTLGAADTTKGHAYKVLVTPSDAWASGSATYSNEVTILNTLPAMTGNAITPTTAYTADTLTSSTHTGSDADGDTVTFTYQWYEDSGIMSGKTSSTLDPAYTTKGKAYKVLITPSDGTGSGSATYSNEVTIQNSAPTAPTITSDLGIHETNHTSAITFTKGTDADSDTVTTYCYVDGTNPPTTLENTTTGTSMVIGLTTALTDGSTYYARCQSYDGVTWNNTYSAVDTFRMNSKPSVPVLVSPTNQSYNSTINQTLDWNASTDAEGDTVTYNLSVNGSVISTGLTASQANLTTHSGAYNWTVQAFDSFESSAYAALFYFWNNDKNFNFSDKSASETVIYQSSGSSIISVKINDSDGTISAATVEITYAGSPSNYAMTLGTNDTWSYTFRSGSPGTYTITGFAATDNLGSTNITTWAQYVVVVPSVAGGSLGSSSATPAPTASTASTNLTYVPTTQINLPNLIQNPIWMIFLQGILILGMLMVGIFVFKDNIKIGTPVTGLLMIILSSWSMGWWK
jgi:hypothetical protein